MDYDSEALKCNITCSLNNVQEYLVTISNKIIEDAVKAVREDCSLENIKWVQRLKI